MNEYINNYQLRNLFKNQYNRQPKIMAHLDSSFMQSSVHTYQNNDGLSQPVNNNFIKHLHLNHRFQRTPYEEQIHPISSPLIKRHYSHNTFETRYNNPPEKFNTFHKHFYENYRDPSPRKSTVEFANIQNQILKISAREIAFNTQKELYAKEIKRLKGQLRYIDEKCQKLQKKTQQLLSYKSKVQILDRQYYKLLRQYERLKDSCKGLNSNYIPQHIPLSLQQLSAHNSSVQNFNSNSKGNIIPKLQSRLLNGRQVSSRIVTTPTEKIEKFSTKVAWKKVSGNQSNIPSPIQKVQQNYRAFTRKSPYDELPLIVSKVQESNSNQNAQIVREELSVYNDYQVGREGARTIDLKEIDRQKYKQFERKNKNLEQQLTELRLKNIQLYKKCEQLQKQKLMYLQAVNKTKYQLAKSITELKQKEVIHKKDFTQIKQERKELQLKLIEVSQELNDRTNKMKLYKLEFEQCQSREKQMKKHLGKVIQSKKNQKMEVKTKELQMKYTKIEAQFNKVKKNWTDLNQKYNEIEIQKKLLEDELNQKKQSICKLEKEISELQSKNTPQQNVIDELQQQSNKEKYIKQLKDSREEDQNFVNLVKELQTQRQQNQRFMQERWMLDQECKRLRGQIMFLKDNCAKLTKIFELQKHENMRLNELRVSWRQIEKKANEMRRIDMAVDHLWQIKQVQYDNLSSILKHIKEIQSNK